MTADQTPWNGPCRSKGGARAFKRRGMPSRSGRPYSGGSLLDAIRDGNVDMALSLAARFPAQAADFEACGYSPLHLAAWMGLLQVVQALASSLDLDAVDALGRKAVEVAAEGSVKEFLRMAMGIRTEHADLEASVDNVGEAGFPARL